MEMKKIIVLMVTLTALLLQACGSSSASAVNETVEDTKNTALTIMYYGDADNNLEPYLLQDVAEMKAGYSASAGYNLVTLFDGISGSTTGFGEAFADTRLYRIGENKSYRLNGGSQFPNITTTSTNYEANMGDAETLKKFIQYCKSNYPANKYVLIMSNHGGGTRSVKSTSSSTGDVKAICWDDTNGEDCLYTGEITDVLTSAESIDVMVLDACLMGSVEFAYQFRTDNGDFNSEYMVASPALVRGLGLPYTKILNRISSTSGNNGTINNLGGGTEVYIIPSSTMDMAEFSKMIVEEQYDDTRSINYSKSEAFSVYDLSNLTVLKAAIDELAISVSSNSSIFNDFENIRGSSETLSSNSLSYFIQTMTIRATWIGIILFLIYMN